MIGRKLLKPCTPGGVIDGAPDRLHLKSIAGHFLDLGPESLQPGKRDLECSNDIGRDRGFVWYSMEFVEGRSLKKLIEQEGHVAPKKALDVAIACARALEAGEAARIVHRDV